MGLVAALRNCLKLRYLIIILSVFLGLYYTEIKNIYERIASSYWQNEESIAVAFTTDTRGDPDVILFTPAQLAKYNGENGAPIYLALLGEVFDVSRGEKHYGPGCSYNFFVGRDASVSFISGQFEHYDPENADDVLTLKPNDLISLNNWKEFYIKDYTYKGKLIGRFYHNDGEPTKYHHKYLALLDQAVIAKAQVDELRTKYPECNIEWSEAKGTRVWCTKSSGGTNRDWIGHPRKLYSRGNKKFHCACIPEDELNDVDSNTNTNTNSDSVIDSSTKALHGDAMFKPYENCAPRAFECFYRL